MPATIVIATLLTGRGPTGVETHINQILALAQRQELPARLVSPHDAHPLGRKLASLVTRLLRAISPERAVMWYRWADAWHLRRCLKAQLDALPAGPVTLYAQDPLSARTALAARRNRPCRVVLVVHYNVSESEEMAAKGLTRPGGALWRQLLRIEREALPRVDQLIFVSDFMRQVVNERLPAVATVPQAVLSNFPPLPDPLACDDEAMADLIAIGTLEPRKNQAFLLRVLAACNARGQRYTLSLVGDGPDRQRLAELATELGVAGQVAFLGFLPAAAKLIPRHRVLVHASRMESQGIVLLEALSYGRPILAPSLGGMREILRDGVEGYVWNLDDQEDAADRLIALLEDPVLWQRLSEHAQATFEQRFHPRVLAARWLEKLTGQAK